MEKHMEQAVNRRELIAIIEELHPEIEVESCTTLITDGILDSFDLISLISEIAEVFHVIITANYITPEYFDSVDTLLLLIEQIKNES